MSFNKDKFKNLVHYVCRKKCLEPEKLGKVKLHKILWLSDGMNFKRQYRSITEEKYIKNDHGPFSVHMDEILDELKVEGKLHIDKDEYYELEKFRLMGKGEADISWLSERQVSMINDVIDEVCENHTATSISDKTHDHIWEIAAVGEEIPLETILVARLAPITEDDVTWAEQELSKLSHG